MAEIASGLVVNGVTEILKKLVPVVSQTIAGAWGVKGDLKKLKKTLEMILAVIADAERRQVNDEAVKLWLERLKDAAYDADNVLDEFSYEVMRRADQMRNLKDKVRNLASSSNPIAFPFKMAHKIKKVNENLNEIAKDMHVFGFQRIPVTNNIDQPNKKKIEVSLGDESVIKGRANDKLALVNSLLQTNMSSSSSSSSSSSIQNHCQYDEKVSVISIVGMGGLGKTTLAKSVYNDKSVVKHFEPKMWVCVADDDRPFDEFKILRDMMEQIDNSISLTNEEVLSRVVKEKLGGKKYLLVLDDLWNEDASKWDKFKIWLNLGAHGSKIIVTTRKNQVAITVRGMIPPYNLRVLSKAHCWSIIKKKAFSPGGALETPNMINIGKEIAKKCCGLPLAATFLGGLMRSKNKEIEWRSIKDQNDIWGKENNIIPVLKLSYDNLPSHLKQCFSYCSIFPKDWVIERKALIRLWMAEGFLPSSNGGNELSIEDIGNEYFESLLSSSFFQDVEKNKLGDIETCKMHDLVLDLAQKVIDKHECATLKVISGQSVNVSEVRRLLLNSNEGVLRTLPQALQDARKLRTVVNFESNGQELDLECFFSNQNLRVLHVGRGIITKGLFSSINKMKHLRYLDLTDSSIQSHDLSTICSFYNLQSLVLHCCENVKSLPNNIGSLKNLRYLDVSFTNIEVLPDSITSLCNLRTLKFDCCGHLKALPSDFGKLKHLISLDLRGTSIQVLPDSCIDNLTNLEIVHLGYSKLLNKEIKNWTKLRHLTYWGLDGTPRGIEKLTLLQILELRELNLLEELDAKRANLRGKLNICELKLYWRISWYSEDDDDDDGGSRSDGDALVLEALQPHPNNLKELCIWGFMGSWFPMWMGGIGVSSSSSSSSCLLMNLVKLELWNCNRCEKLPALGQLPNLRILWISVMKSVRRMGEELYGSGENLFPSLIELRLFNMESLEEWVAPPHLSSKIDNRATYSFPLLEDLNIEWCPKLTVLPDLQGFTTLRRLTIKGCNDELKKSLPNDRNCLSFIEKLDVDFWAK